MKTNNVKQQCLHSFMIKIKIMWKKTHNEHNDTIMIMVLKHDIKKKNARPCMSKLVKAFAFWFYETENSDPFHCECDKSPINTKLAWFCLMIWRIHNKSISTMYFAKCEKML